MILTANYDVVWLLCKNGHEDVEECTILMVKFVF